MSHPAPTPIVTPELPPAPDKPQESARELLGRRGPLIQALTHLGLCAGTEVSKLVAEMHAVIAASPGLTNRPWQKTHHRDAPLPYRIVTGTFHGLSRLVNRVSDADVELSEERARRLRSILNGVAGDKLARWHNRLALSMELVNAEGVPQHPESDPASSSKGDVIFIHGLCHSELDWQSPAHTDFVNQLRNQGYGVHWLRYNSGLAIHENGANLSNLLQKLPGDRPLILIGHSMGGLLIRSACQVALQQSATWLYRLTEAVYLGSPHLGAPLERSGNLLNIVVGVTPYSRPFTRLGNIRSQGIRDLRYGYIDAEHSTAGADSTEDVRPALETLPGHVRHLLLAGKLESPVGQSWIGDGLVPESSALAQDKKPSRTLQAEAISHISLNQLGHIAMLSDQRVYDALKDWLGVV